MYKKTKTLKKSDLLKLFVPIFSLSLVACGESDAIVSKWKFGQAKGWYPLKSEGEIVLASSMKAFINSTSMIVDCRGKAIKQGRYFVYIDEKNKLLFYSNEAKQVSATYPPSTVLETPSRRISDFDSISIDLSLINSGKDTQPQCE